MGRPRRAASRSAQAHMQHAHESHYLGYVEDEETPDMIMRKFAALEAMQQTAKEGSGSPGDGKQEGKLEGGAVDDKDASLPQAEPETPAGEGPSSPPNNDNEKDGFMLTSEQMAELFKQTSVFSVKSACAGVGMEIDGNAEADADADYFYENLGEFYEGDSDFDEDDFWGEGKRRKKGRGGGTSRGGLGRERSGGNQRSVNIIKRTPDGVIIRRRGKENADDEPMGPLLIKVPQKIPLSWGRTVAPYRRCNKTRRTSFELPTKKEVGGIVSANVAEAYKHWPKHAKLHQCDAYKRDDFDGVMLSPGWEWAGIPDAHTLSKSELSDLRLERLRSLQVHKYCKDGFIFIWVSKEDLAQIVHLMYEHKFAYVENLTWVQLAANNAISRRASPCVRRGHHTLYIFRKLSEASRKIELKHQRSPDVVLDFMRVDARGNLRAPEEVYTSIETLLPNGKGKLLELYAPCGADYAPISRDGWVCVSQE